ncbi:MAG: sulfatase-like hydrolase/transferase [Gemmataceae bacterium]
MKRIVVCMISACVWWPAADSRAAEAGKPNIIVILADDLGWSDVGFNGCREIPTPNLDALAKSGVRLQAGYASHPYCSPSRAGLLSGRYSQRFGHECNPGFNKTDGLPLEETLLPAVLKQHGYATAAIGKWHLGDDPKFWPTERGFDFWYGFSGGGMSYWGDTNPKTPLRGVLRNGKPVPKSELTYLTDDFSREAADFIGRSRGKPFFLYLAYNAPHSPDHATRTHLKKTEHIEYGGRAVYGAMVAGMDEGIGRVLRKLDELELRDNTLIFFYSDNGGRAEHAVNFPFRGHKGMLFEGGLRVPFCVSWPGHIPAGQTVKQPITGLDVFPTALAAAGIKAPARVGLDGVNVLPVLEDPKRELPARTLFWRYTTGENEYGYAVRAGRYKLVSSIYKGRKLLFDLDADPYEEHDIADRNPILVRELTQQYDDWAKQLKKPLWLDPHGVNVRKEEAARQQAVDNASRGEKRE